MKFQTIPLGEKDYLNPQEAIKHWNLSSRKFYAFLKNGPYSFIALYKNRKLILRADFERYLTTHLDVKERLANGTPRKKRF